MTDDTNFRKKREKKVTGERKAPPSSLALPLGLTACVGEERKTTRFPRLTNAHYTETMECRSAQGGEKRNKVKKRKPIQMAAAEIYQFRVLYCSAAPHIQGALAASEITRLHAVS